MTGRSVQVDRRPDQIFECSAVTDADTLHDGDFRRSGPTDLRPRTPEHADHRDAPVAARLPSGTGRAGAAGDLQNVRPMIAQRIDALHQSSSRRFMAVIGTERKSPISFSRLLEVTMTSAPVALAICSPNSATPPVPCTTTRSPLRRCPSRQERTRRSGPHRARYSPPPRRGSSELGRTSLQGKPHIRTGRPDAPLRASDRQASCRLPGRKPSSQSGAKGGDHAIARLETRPRSCRRPRPLRFISEARHQGESEIRAPCRSPVPACRDS